MQMVPDDIWQYTRCYPSQFDMALWHKGTWYRPTVLLQCWSENTFYFGMERQPVQGWIKLEILVFKLSHENPSCVFLFSFLHLMRLFFWSLSNWYYCSHVNSSRILCFCFTIWFYWLYQLRSSVVTNSICDGIPAISTVSAFTEVFFFLVPHSVSTKGYYGDFIQPQTYSMRLHGC